MCECGISDPIGFDAWKLWVSHNSELWPIMKNGDMIGGVLFIGHTVHIAVRPEWHGRWITKEMLRAYEFWRPECDVYAYIRNDNEVAKRFARRLGFMETEGNEKYAVFVKRKRDESTAHQA